MFYTVEAWAGTAVGYIVYLDAEGKVEKIDVMLAREEQHRREDSAVNGSRFVAAIECFDFQKPAGRGHKKKKVLGFEAMGPADTAIPRTARRPPTALVDRLHRPSESRAPDGSSPC